MKILIIHKWLVAGGVERILMNYLRIFQSLNYEIDLLIKYDLETENFLEYLIPNRVNYEFLLTKDFYNKLKSPQKKTMFSKVKREILKFKDNYYLEKKLKSIYKDNHYDIIIDFSECLDKLIRYSNFINKNNILTFRWIHGQLNLSDFKNTKKYQLIFSNHHRVITICEQMKENVVKQLDYKIDNMYTIYNPIDLDELASLSIEKLPIKYNKLINSKYILQVSRLVDGKGHIELLEIYAILKKLGVTHKLYFIGDGDNRKNLENKIKELGLTNDCFLLGEIKNPYPYFKNADLFVHTSESEGLPTVLLESMALGVPVVAMDCPTGPKDILGANSEYGKLIPTHNKEMFVAGVMELLNNDVLWQDYSRKSLERIQDFSSEKIAQQIDAIFKQMIKKDI